MTTTLTPVPMNTDTAHQCELCNLDVGPDYHSDRRCNDTGLGVVLHERCAAVLEPLGDTAFVTLLSVARETHKLVGYMGLELDLEGAASERRERARR